MGAYGSHFCPRETVELSRCVHAGHEMLPCRWRVCYGTQRGFQQDDSIYARFAFSESSSFATCNLRILIFMPDIVGIINTMPQ
jgi:hypothetical protein